MNSKRVFLGIPVPGKVKEKFKPLQEELKKIEGRLKIVPLENLHFTLKFLGEVKEDRIERVKEILKKLNLGFRFKVKIKKVGAFPNENYVQVIWLGLEDDEKIFDLQRKTDFGLSKLFPVERDFLAHLTLARVKSIKDKEELKSFLIKFKEIDLGELEIDKIILYESVLKKEGPEYRVIEEYRLG